MERAYRISLSILFYVTESEHGQNPVCAWSAYELYEFNHILANQKLVELARKVDHVNPKQKS